MKKRLGKVPASEPETVANKLPIRLSLWYVSVPRLWTHLLCNVLATFEVMVSIRQDLRLHNRHNAILQVREE